MPENTRKYERILSLVSTYMAPTVCSELSNPANGGVSWTGLTSGSTATYTCNTGYQLTGAQTRTCQSNGTWSGQAPTCTRMTILNMIEFK